jgi:hypothetical protein
MKRCIAIGSILFAMLAGVLALASWRAYSPMTPPLARGPGDGLASV